MGDISLHTSTKEFQCRCPCKICRPSPQIVDRVEVIRWGVNIEARLSFFDPVPDIKFHFTSGCSCKAHNDKPQSEGGRGGSATSEHVVVARECGFCEGQGYSVSSDGFEFNCSECDDSIGTLFTPSNAVDGFFYYGKLSGNHRVDASDVLIYAWEMEIIQGLVLYPKKRIHASTGRRYNNYDDRR